MEQGQKTDGAAQRQMRAYRNRLREMLAATETEDGTSLLRELQDLALEVSAGVPPFQEGNGAEADIHELLADIYEALRAKSTRGIRRLAARNRLVSLVAAVFGAIARLPREAAGL